MNVSSGSISLSARRIAPLALFTFLMKYVSEIRSASYAAFPSSGLLWRLLGATTTSFSKTNRSPSQMHKNGEEDAEFAPHSQQSEQVDSQQAQVPGEEEAPEESPAAESLPPAQPQSLPPAHRANNGKKSRLCEISPARSTAETAIIIRPYLPTQKE
jgi:hypothetical protein